VPPARRRSTVAGLRNVAISLRNDEEEDGMSNRMFNRRQVLKIGAFGGSAAILAACAPTAQSPAPTGSGGPAATSTPGSGTPGPTGARNPFDLPPIEGATLITDPAMIPTSFNEAPSLATRVAAGTLPPVAERIGQDPLVLKPIHEIGKYGGTIRRAFMGPGDYVNPARFNSGTDNLLWYDYEWKTVIPNIARDYELSSDAREVMLYLRRGMKWSDGEPFTADDIIFWFEDIYDVNDDNLIPGLQAAATSGGEPVQVTKVDDFTLRFTSAAAYPLLIDQFSGWGPLGGQAAWGYLAQGAFAPKHYLSQFLPKYSSEAEADNLAKAAGFDGWPTYVKHLDSAHANVDLPTVTPWIATTAISNPTFIYERNPYSIWVDTEGNQLPYLDEIRYTNAESIELINLRAIAGELDSQDRHLNITGLPVLLENEERSDYTVYLNAVQQPDYGLRINLAWNNDPVIGDLIRTADFRRAISMGIDRDEINEVFFLGTSTPCSASPSADNKYFPGDEWITKWATLDPDAANALLDGLGLTEKDASGIRIRPDGAGPIQLDYQANRSFADFPAIGEMVREHLRNNIGIDMQVTEIAGNLLTERALSGDLQFGGHQVGSDEPFLNPNTAVPVDTGGFSGMMGIPFARWFASGGTDGVEPPQDIKDLRELWDRGLASNEAERIEIGKEIWQHHVDNVYSVGIVGYGFLIYGIHYAKNGLGNVPKRIVNSLIIRSHNNVYPQTWYWKDA
jgi:peptide/nickel transport system substrate-binding protein